MFPDTLTLDSYREFWKRQFCNDRFISSHCDITNSSQINTQGPSDHQSAWRCVLDKTWNVATQSSKSSWTVSIFNLLIITWMNDNLHKRVVTCHYTIIRVLLEHQDQHKIFLSWMQVMFSNTTYTYNTQTLPKHPPTTCLSDYIYLTWKSTKILYHRIHQGYPRQGSLDFRGRLKLILFYNSISTNWKWMISLKGHFWYRYLPSLQWVRWS